MTSSRVSITEQATVNCYLLKFYNIKVKLFAKISFVVRQNDFRTSFHVTMIYKKQRKPLTADNSQMAVISLSMKWRQPCVCTLIDHGSRAVKS